MNQKCKDLELENDKLRSRLEYYADKYDDFVQKMSNEELQNAAATTEPETRSTVINAISNDLDESSVEKRNF